MSFLNKIKKGMGFKKPEQENKAKKEKEKKMKNKKIGEEKEEKKDEWFEPEGELAVDVYQTPKYFVIEAPVAGIRTEDLDITIETDTIKIKGKRERPKKIKNENYLIQECYWGSFSREIIFPAEVDGSKTDASIQQGILVIKIPKIEEQEEQKIKIKEK